MSYYEENRPEQIAFYKTWTWKKCREQYFKKAKGLCERCLAKGLIKQGEIVHHKIEMNSETIHNPKLAYGFDNLELLCRDCHNEVHENRKRFAGKSKRYTINDKGEVLINGEN